MRFYWTVRKGVNLALHCQARKEGVISARRSDDSSIRLAYTNTAGRLMSFVRWCWTCVKVGMFSDELFLDTLHPNLQNILASKKTLWFTDSFIVYKAILCRMTSFTLHNSMMVIIIIFLCFVNKEGGVEKLNDLPWVTHLINEQAGLQD